jgi:hypothetical protein
MNFVCIIEIYYATMQMKIRSDKCKCLSFCAIIIQTYNLIILSHIQIQTGKASPFFFISFYSRYLWIDKFFYYIHIYRYAHIVNLSVIESFISYVDRKTWWSGKRFFNSFSICRNKYHKTQWNSHIIYWGINEKNKWNLLLEKKTK